MLRLILASLSLISLATVATLATDARATEDEPRFPAPCEGELAIAPAMYAISIRPWFKNYPYIRSRVDIVREYGQPYLTEKELGDLVLAMDALEDGRGDQYRHRGLISVLLNAAEDNLTREFAAQVDRVTANLARNAEIVLANGDVEHHDWLMELLLRTEHYRGGISVERGAWYWQHARHEAARILELDSELPAWIAERRRRIAVTEPSETRGDFEFVTTLDTLGPKLRRYALRFALQRLYYRTPPRSTPDHRAMAHVGDLNRSLSFLSAPPELNADQTRASLVGSALIKGVVTPVLITFDSRHRFFTVRTLDFDRDSAAYYQMTIGEEGRLTFLDASPVAPEVADRRPDLTYFAY